MAEKKITFIIPGFRHKPSSKAYKEIAKMLKKEGHTTVPITIPWNQSTILDNTTYFINQYKRKLLKYSKDATRKKTYILGFSFGAMIAFLASTKIKVSGLILCSLSPYFKEDIIKMKEGKKSSLEKNRYRDFSQLRSRKLAKETKAKKVVMLYGSKESKPLIRRVTKTYKQLPSIYKYLLPIEKTEHDIGNKKYLYAIHQVTSKLL